MKLTNIQDIPEAVEHAKPSPSDIPDPVTEEKIPPKDTEPEFITRKGNNISTRSGRRSGEPNGYRDPQDRSDRFKCMHIVHSSA